MKASLVLSSPDPARDTNEVTNENGTDGKGNAMKRKAPLRYDNAIGCVLLWAAVIRPDRRTAMKWLRLAVRERNLKANSNEIPWADGSEFRMFRKIEEERDSWDYAAATHETPKGGNETTPPVAPGNPARGFHSDPSEAGRE